MCYLLIRRRLCQQNRSRTPVWKTWGAFAAPFLSCLEGLSEVPPQLQVIPLIHSGYSHAETRFGLGADIYESTGAHESRTRLYTSFDLDLHHV